MEAVNSEFSSHGLTQNQTKSFLLEGQAFNPSSHALVFLTVSREEFTGAATIC